MRSFAINTPIKTIRHHSVFTKTRLNAQPLTQALTSKLDPLFPLCDSTETKERSLEDAQTEAEAQAEYLNIELDISHARIIALVLAYEGNKRNSPLIKNLTQNQKPSDQRKPVLGTQLDEMRVWPETLSKLDNNDIKTQGTALAALITQCDTAEENKAQCEQRLSDFRLLGDKKNLVDTANSIRKALWAELEQIKLSNPHLHLPSDWEDSFFLQETRTREHTLTSVAEALTRVEKEKARLLAIQVKLQEAKAQKEKERELAIAQEVQEELAELAKMKQEIEQREAELTQKLSK